MEASTYVAAASAALVGPGTALREAEFTVPRSPGLYAIYGASHVWQELGLGKPGDDRPLYVGKSESSLADRDIKQHFGDGRTGSSTVRRSVAALLRERLGLHPQPRNPAKPADFDRYALSAPEDAKLTAWMRGHLMISVWPALKLDQPLAVIEKEILKAWNPPLNLTHVERTSLTDLLKAKRAEMARAAEAAA